MRESSCATGTWSCVHVEGTRQRFGHPGPLHPGALMIAMQEGVPVIPCAVDTLRLAAVEPAQMLRSSGASR